MYRHLQQARRDGFNPALAPPAQAGPVFIYRCQGHADGSLYLQAHNRGRLPTHTQDPRTQQAWHANPQGQWLPADPAGPRDGYEPRIIGEDRPRVGRDEPRPGDGDDPNYGDGHTPLPGDGHTPLPGDGDTPRPGDGDEPKQKPCNSPLGCDGGDGLE